MADMLGTAFLAIFQWIQLISVVEAYDQCYPRYASSFTCYEDHEYCCGSNYDCCTYLSVGAIIGVVVGCLLAVGLLITFICICLQKNKRRPGMVVRPNQQGTISYVAYNGQPQYGQNPYGQHQYMNAQQYDQQPYMAPPPYSAVQFTHPAPAHVAENNKAPNE